MQPERRRESSERTGIARARMYLKSDLDWLEGFPIAQGMGFVEWQPKPKLGDVLPQRLRIDRERLTRTQLTLTKLVNRFPRAMPKVVGDVEAWRLRVNSVLDRLKEAIHGGVDLLHQQRWPMDLLPRSQADSLDRWLASNPSLQSVARAVIWSGAVNPTSRDELLTWLALNSEWLGRHIEIVGVDQGLANVLLVGELVREEGAEDWQWLGPILSESRGFTVPTQGFDPHVGSLIGWVRHWRDATSPPAFPERPVATFGPQVVEFVRQVATQGRAARRRAARLAALVLDARLVESWSTAWSKLDRGCSAAIRGLQEQAKYLTKWEFGFQKETLISTLEGLRETKTDPLPLSDILRNILSVSRDASQRLAFALSEALASVPSNPGMTSEETGFDWRSWTLRGATLEELTRTIYDRDLERRVLRYLELFADFFRRHRTEPWVYAPWQTLMKKWSREKHYWCSLFNALQGKQPATKHWPALFEIIGRLAAHPQYSDEHHEELIALFEATPDVDIVCRRYLEVLPTGKLADVYSTTLSAASALEVEPKTFATLCEVLHSIDSDEWRTSSKVVSLHECLRSAGWLKLIPQMLCRGEVSLVTTTATRLALLRELKQTLLPTARPTNPQLPEWASSLPESLHEPIRVLAAVSPNARSQAEGLLERYFPSPDKLDREISAIEQRLSSAHNREHLEKRLSNLRQRRDAPTPVPTETVTRLREKLEELATRTVLTSFRETIEAELAEQFCARAGFQQIAEQLSTPRYLELVAGIVKLPEPFREFGLRLLRRRWGNQPWDSASEPGNQRFMERMRSRGLNVEPWLTPPPPQVVADQNGRAITIAFEQDDVERLLMGYYFDTCLSPRGFNFFSAVTNTVDLNKRVMFARDAANNVIGRCLLAIGDAGTILTFNPYCQDSQFPFGQHVAAIAAQLAHEMGTVVSHLDQVSPLLTPRWYDDGACDLGLSITSESSALRAAIRSATDETLASVLEAALAPHGLTDTTLSLVIEMPEMTQRPQLIGSLLPRLEQGESRLTPTTLIQAASLAREANGHDFAARIIGRHGPEWLIHWYRHHGQFVGTAERAIDTLLSYHPSAALRVLRQTRRRSVRNDESEHDPHRRKLLAAAHKALGRETLANTLTTRSHNAGNR